MSARLRTRWRYKFIEWRQVLRIRHWQQKQRFRLSIRKYLVVAISIGLLVGGMVIFLGYWLKWDWTGFNSGTSQITITNTFKGNYTATVPQPSKSLWDWLNLLGVLAIPVAVALGTIWFTRQQAKVSDAENKDNQREAALQKYIDSMSELLLHEKLRNAAENDEARIIARVRTLTVLPGLDAKRKGSVLQFLHESRLIGKKERVIDLGGANLKEVYLYEGNLSEANLHETILWQANLSSADLHGADMNRASLWKADLSYANLTGTNLVGAELNGASLYRADLRGANLREALLEEANLRNATGITVEELEKQATSLKGATMPDGTNHP